MPAPARVWLQAAAVVTILAGSTLLVERFLPVARRDLALAIAFVIVQTASIVLMFTILLARRSAAQRRARRAREVLGAAQAAVAEHAAGTDRLRVLRGLQVRSAADVAAAVTSFLATARGSMRDRVTALARDLELRDGEQMVERSLGQAAGGSLLDRALMADRLRPDAELLARREIPHALASDDEHRAAAALDLLLSWRRMLPVAGFANALKHPDPDVRSRAYRAIPYVQPPPAAWVGEGLGDPSPSVRVAAAETATVLRSPEALHILEHALQDEQREVALAAAFALAAVPGGIAVLRQSHAPVALEALEKASMNRLER